MIKSRQYRILVITIIVAVAGWLLFWIASQGRITIDLPEGSKNIELIGNGFRVVFETGERQVSKTVPAGSYTVIITGESGSYLALVRAGRFLRGPTINASTLIPEINRGFIGDEPRSCPVMIQGKLLSYTCGSTINSLVYHAPATAEMPTITRAIPSTVGGANLEAANEVVEGVVELDSEAYVITRIKDVDSVVRKLYSLSFVNGLPQKTFIRTIYDLKETSYRFISSADKKLLALGNSQVLSGNNFENLKPLELADSGVLGTGNFVDRSQDGQLLYAATKTAQGTNGTGTTVTGTELTVFGNKHLSKLFDKPLSVVLFCGENICTISDEGLSVWNESFRLLHTIPGVKGVVVDKSQNILTYTDKVVYRLDPAAFTGSIVYASSYYSVNYVGIAGDNTIISISSANKKHALLLNSGPQRSDEAFRPFFENKYINTVSIYGDIAYVSPELGEMVFNPANEAYDYSEEAKQAARESIFGLIDDLNIESKGYRIRVNIVGKP